MDATVLLASTDTPGLTLAGASSGIDADVDEVDKVDAVLVEEATAGLMSAASCGVFPLSEF